MITTLIVFLALLVVAIVGLGLWSRRSMEMLEARFDRDGRDVEVEGGVVNVYEMGDRRSDGPPVVLVHGAGKNLKDLKISLGERLAQDRRVVLIDRPGQGWSDRIRRDDIATPEGQAIVLNQALAQIGIDRPLIVGHDWGAALALSYGLSYPEEIAGIVAISPASHPTFRAPPLLTRIAASGLLGRIASHLLGPALGPVAAAAALRRDFWPHRVPGDYTEAAATALGQRPQSFAAMAADTAALDEFLAEQSAYYGQITAPLVVITGDQDAVTSSVNNAEKLAAAVPRARLVMLNDVGHMPHHSTPNVIAFEVNRLAESL